MCGLAMRQCPLQTARGKASFIIVLGKCLPQQQWPVVGRAGISSLSGQSGKHSSSLPQSPVPPQQQWAEMGRVDGSVQSTAEGTGVQQMCGVQNFM